MALAIGSHIIPFALRGTDGVLHRSEDSAGAPVVGVIFHCNHCPYAQAWEDRLIALQRAYAARGVRLVLVNPNDPVKYPADDFAHMEARAEEKGYPFPYLHDETQEVARAYGATRTPEVFLFDRTGALRYHGAPDDNYEDPAAVLSPYLRDAIEALLAGTTPSTPRTTPVGCTIKWR